MSELTTIRFNLEDGTYEATPHNAWATVHPEDIQQYDNIYIELEDDPDDEPMGRTIFREELDDDQPLDKVVGFMAVRGFTVVRSRDVSDIDLEEYQRQYGTPEPENIAAHYTHDLPKRQENKLTYTRWILEKNHLTPPDFNQPGELYL